MRVIQQANVDNFDALLANPSAITKDPNLLTMTRKRNKTTPKGTLSYPSAVAQDLVHHLVHSFEVFYAAKAAAKDDSSKLKAAKRLAVAENKAREKLLLAAEKAAERKRQADEKQAACKRAAKKASQILSTPKGQGTWLGQNPEVQGPVGWLGHN
ncbi:uncharacterized protein PGTG_03074 [Puccinia graminis f. sp. tritici CRL 75-36-700-3]|uniref:ATP-dependent DNA helicase sgs1 n=1 Tax=Puccinia graminis f. sp. tritici (strain CRL 75-36-700-3 / race SCCL) TaxID=418459 RepID=E3JYJ3_PUCGT|nr:uncharacterized protein PGTG_03074 [Puccinia graminis f. sp. tritici CRL 75-36-700-3]EFP77118.2 hypothetical protein PGTG_03074 [Puccinia graminis f. sp. tritici CRL 75-36-700-3]